MKKINIFLCVFVLVWAIPHEKKARACSCIELPSVSEAREEADAVFLGIITDIEDLQIQREVTINVREAWKGVRTKTIKIYTGFNDGDCGLPITIGESYLFYATDGSERNDDGFLTSNICTRTTAEANAMEDLKELGAGKKEFTQEEPSSFADGQSRWIITSILGSIVFLLILYGFFLKKRN
ncbi:hypothetical protein [Sporosarcina gallistercoris]|uniref:Tissue inhibitor of metalloproteinase n=1 Tax=Sporosarcina gallistercoris TaxID=2762245 RepID=A0ABR8PI62_9BACL|nr:hypothetical protein [Sporosarcina gallistercoris]MBD7907866.1 hypothetical protein [Sporosarcina gallistercoris]